MIKEEIKTFFYRLQNEKSDNNDETPGQVLTKPYADIYIDDKGVSDHDFFEK